MMLGTNTLVLLLVISSQLTQGANSQVDEDDECHITATKLLKKLSKCHGQKTDEMNIFLEIQAVKSEILEELSTIKKMLRNNNNNHCAQPGLKWINTGGKKYFFSDIQASWYDSKDFCSKNGAQLASVKSEIEMEELHKKIQTLKNRANQYFWTSANDIGMSGKFVWNDGTPLLNSSKLWHIGETYQEPNEFGRGRETCVNVNSGFLYDFQCNGDLFYICEFTGST
ncbi:CD209 antigen-like protein E isoform X2 [Cloeon dipterum]|uniref:CD209 antigen-like protein E isoform X2 n=1 Tax=Cloeon dipterum TaxID=197152 RepID=UPI00321F63F3